LKSGTSSIRQPLIDSFQTIVRNYFVLRVTLQNNIDHFYFSSGPEDKDRQDLKPTKIYHLTPSIGSLYIYNI